LSARHRVLALALGGLGLLASGCERDEPVRARDAGNVLLLIADDIGTDKIGAFAEHPTIPPTPNLDALAARGVLFRNAYAAPVCSPSRAAILTGRQPRRYQLGSYIRLGDELPLGELTIPEMLDTSGYDHSAVGKWHLSSDEDDALRHPLDSGFRWHAGSIGNISHASYFNWPKVTNGEAGRSHTYATTDTVNDAIARLEAMQSPWFLWVAFNAAHHPPHEPPETLHTQTSFRDDIDRYDATVEAMDTEIGRLLGAMEPDVMARTTVILVSDNGTPSWGVRPPRTATKAKATLYEGGVNVPLIIAGPVVGVPGWKSDALVHVVDLFATVVDIAGVDPGRLEDEEGQPIAIDGVSLLSLLADPTSTPPREEVYVDVFGPNGPGPYEIDRRMIRNERYKLIEYAHDGIHEFYDLDGRLDDGPDRMGSLDAEQQEAYKRLSGRLSETLAELRSDGDP
jgi:arylsulfatase A-like enzyme